ncbi:hypothetical protein F2Q69_00027608 [Brassica cretica]|uniref:Uncharacterized protein n=1 Tax=Brassica cretica TaxID=69181 RepID=A0A8S9RTE6_BRACR|nr:hypothetical protein F2Q69_00027608 [Brassica cretica]
MESSVNGNCVGDGRGGAGLDFPETHRLGLKFCQSDGTTGSSGRQGVTSFSALDKYENGSAFRPLLQLAGSRIQDWKFFQAPSGNLLKRVWLATHCWVFVRG